MGVPAAAPRRRAEQVPGKGPIIFVARLLGHQQLNVPQVAGQVAPHRGVILIFVRPGQFQKLRHRQQPRLGQGVGVILQPQPVRSRQGQRADCRQQPLPIGRRVVDPEKAGLPRVHLEPVIAPGRRRQPQPGLGGVHHYRPGRRALPVAALRHAHRHLPHRRLRRRPQQMVIDKPLLGQRQLHPVRRFRRLHRQHRVAGLGNPAVHNRRHRLLRHRLHRRPQIPGARIGVLVSFQILMQPLPKDLRRQKLLQHPNHRRPLAVADGVKQLADFRRVVNFLLNGMGVLETVQAQGPVRIHIDELRPHLPFRESPIHRFSSHPRGKTFVQPQVIPPLHSHQIPKPHMGHFVGYHLGHPLPGAGRGVGCVHQQRRFPIGNRPPVFHRPGGEVRDSDVVQLFQRIGDAEVIIKEPQHPRRSFQREPPLLLFPSGRPHRHPGIVDRFLLDRGQIPHHESQQVSGHNRRFGEHHRLIAGVQPRLVDNRRVGDRHHIGGNVQRQLKSGFARRFIPAGKGPPRVRGLELSGRQVSRFPFRVHILAAVKAAQLVVQLPGKAQIQLGCAGIDRLGKRQDSRFPLLIQGNGRGPRALAALRQSSGVDGQLVGVQLDFRSRRGHLQVDNFQPVESELLEIGLQSNAIPGRSRILRQNNGVGSGHKKFLPVGSVKLRDVV